MNDDDALIIIEIFSSTKGKKALRILADRARSLVRLDQRPIPSTPATPGDGNSLGNPGYGGQPNEAFLNPNAALYRAGMEDQLAFIRRLVENKEKKYGYKTINLSEIQERERERERDISVQSLRGPSDE